MKWGIKHQVLLLALVPTITISVLLSAFFTSSRLQDLENSFREYGEAIGLKLAVVSEYGVFSQNKLLLQSLADATLTEHNAQSVTFYTKNGEEIVSVGQPHLPFTPPTETEPYSEKFFIQENKDSIAFLHPVVIRQEIHEVHSELGQNQRIIGWLKLELETKSIHIRQSKILMHTCMIYLLGLSISGLLAFQMSRHVTRPVLELAQAVERIKKGKLNTRIRTSAYQEIEVLESGINTMAQALENAHSELQHKIDQATLSLRRTLETIEVQNIELEIARRAAENASKIKSEFLADMSHEIRNPLNGVIGFINLLQKTELNKKQHEYITTIQKSAGNLLAIINDILDFSKIEAGKLRIENTPLDIRDCIDETLNLLAPHAHEKNIALIPLIYSDVPPIVMGDPLRIKQIITNLVSNSIKFTDHGSIIIRVILESESISHLVIRTSVTDTGIGLSSEEQKLLFQAFNQTKIDTSRKFGGTGLGLVICKKLVEQMGGNIGVESESQKGATFWFTFQVNKYIETPIHSGNNALSYSQAFIANAEHTVADDANDTCLTASESKSSLVKVLAVDDNPENLKLITVLLEEMGFEVAIAASAEEAIEAVRHYLFNLIFMDIRMPRMNGIEAAHIIRKLEADNQRRPTPIIALTAHALASEKKALLAAGIDDYLSKPIGEPELKAILDKWVPKPSAPAIFDWELAKKLAGGRAELAKEFFEKLIASLPQDRSRILESYQAQNWKALRDHVHKLHGACCYCGVPQLKECARILEDAALTRVSGIIKPQMDAFDSAVNALLSQAESIIATL